MKSVSNRSRKKKKKGSVKEQVRRKRTKRMNFHEKIWERKRNIKESIGEVFFREKKKKKKW